MLGIGLIFAALAAALHVAIFVMESFTWTSPRTRRVFGLRPEQAEATEEMAFNQGFYNLFLAVVTVIGLILAALGLFYPGVALMLAGTGSMLAAALVLFFSAPAKRRAAVTQGALPLIAVVCTAAAIV
ncbi:DUF1304 domain-containing protein [Microbacterium gorillae]|uniref:DUF1304 domain-containing protein n=1 Tax=Microbacterium gorillae TaxID=1231063 RepID=UPI00058E7556|nr:DUF1304 domain-containing protein [Microbacterium gorillae]